MISIMEEYLKTGYVPGRNELDIPGPPGATQSILSGESEAETQRPTPQRQGVSRESVFEAAIKQMPEQAKSLTAAEMRERRQQLKAEKNRPRDLEYYMEKVKKKPGDIHNLEVN